jgi:regulator of sigma E protease
LIEMVGSRPPSEAASSHNASAAAFHSPLSNLISFIAVLSVNLGLINLFPIPVLDGGHLLFYFFEAVRGRPLPRRAQEYSFRAGIALLAGLFIFATWNDLAHIGLFRWVAGLMG